MKFLPGRFAFTRFVVIVFLVLCDERSFIAIAILPSMILGKESSDNFV